MRCTCHLVEPALHPDADPPLRPMRCTRDAVVWLYGPDGDAVPGGRMCRDCADEVVREYREKLGEVWTTRPLDECGHVVGEEGEVR